MKHNLSKTAMIAMLAMIPASVATAQFVADDDAPVVVQRHTDDSRKQSTSNTTWVQHVTEDDGREYSIQLKDGVYTVKVDGKKVPESWIHKKENAIIVIDDHGDTVYEFKATPYTRTDEGKVFVARPQSANAPFTWSSATAPDFDASQLKVKLEQPKVMLGVNMSEPSDALRKHLKLGDRKVIMIDQVIEGLPAQKAGMEDYDIIISIDGSDNASNEVLHKALMEHEAGDVLKIRVLRAGDEITLKPELVEYNAEKLGSVRFGVTIETEDGNTWISEDGQTEIRVHDVKEQHREQRELHEDMMRRAEEAMSKAQNQLLELRDGELFVARRKEEARDTYDRLRERLAKIETELAMRSERGGFDDDRVEILEDRLSRMEDELHAQMERLEGRMERLMGMLEHMFEKLAENKED